MNRRVVVTGMGIASPLGVGVEPVWSKLIAGKSGIRRLPDEIAVRIGCKIAGIVPSSHEDNDGFDLGKLMNSKDQNKTSRFMQLALDAAGQAVRQAGWLPADESERERTATIIGSSIGGFSTAAKAARMFEANGGERMSPFTIPSFLMNLAAGHVSIRYGFKGPSNAPATSCVASAQAIGDGLRMISCGEVDVAVCGGAESCIDPAILGSFIAARAVTTSYNDSPGQASRPFDRDRNGFVLAEGAAVIVLESLEHATRRGAEPLAELVGHGTCSDAYHITACMDNGEGLQRSMRLAIKMAGISADDIGYINAHGTSTPLGDKSELKAIHEIFGARSNVIISSTKSATGHPLGAAGSMEAIFSILALRDGILPPTLNLNTPDPVCDGLDIIGGRPCRKNVRYVLSNSAGFGGVNASLIFKRWDGH